MIPNALFVRGRRQYVMFIAGMGVLAIAGLSFFRTDRGARVCVTAGGINPATQATNRLWAARAGATA
jgi:hypothetical protein